MRSATYMTIRDAILNKQQVTATYQGHIRQMCPHVIGTKDGREQVLFYQFGGTSSSGGRMVPGSRNNWRCIPIAGLRNVTVCDGPWYTASNHSVPQTCVEIVDVVVTL